MRLVDVHSPCGTHRAYPFETLQGLAQQRATWNSGPPYHSETKMVADFRENGVRAILDMGYGKARALEEMRTLHDATFETEAAPCDVIHGHQIHIDPLRAGPDGVKELRRGFDKKIGFLDYAMSASLSPPASTPEGKLDDKLCIETGVPVLIFVGSTGLGAAELNHEPHRTLSGGDYSLFSCERLVEGWHAAGYPPQVLAPVLFRNAERLLAETGFKGRI